MSDELKDLKPGDKIAFDVSASKQTPYGFGIVTKVTAVGPLIQPDYPLAKGVVMTNIRKVGTVR